jgi:hypothetical protein
MSTPARHESNLKMFVVLFVCGMSILYVIVNAYMEWSLHQEEIRRWQTVPRQQWPNSLKELLDSAKQTQIEPESIKVFYRHWSEDWYWEFSSSPQLLHLMTDRWKLTKIDRDHNGVKGAILCFPPPEFLPPADFDHVDYYVSEGYGEEGMSYLIIDDSANKRIIVRKSGYSFRDEFERKNDER